ncbi:RIIa domain-containing protein 1-like isoform X1 [Syngnathus typhle]|uniref:RIIa domain-containing protein 1-like isoform X1 n=1 Tax=Syngnathus typhle TaxID=161592 RepID=UPI002A69FD98|nr:RIIa domain-containing protein 1-like isoform X1 [Syngnathus typhle]XP_061144539.1 RIIa domain-containing protein 1-like isoform X1 [Syngnathus typhle]
MSVQGGFGVLNAEQLEKLRQFKIQTRIDNEHYLMAHPEVEVMVEDFLRFDHFVFSTVCVSAKITTRDLFFREVLLKKPTRIRAFAAEHFTNPDLHIGINAKMATINIDA